MANLDFPSIYHRVIYIILHYCSLWMILTCIISANISWRLFKISNKQNQPTGDAYLAWWTTTVWGSTALLFFLVGLLFS
jgi:hypothetical protein